MNLLLNSLIIGILSKSLLVLAEVYDDTEDYWESCKSVASLKGVVHMMESVSSALNDMISSAKFRTEGIEDKLCSENIRQNYLRVSSPKTENADHCINAQPDCKSLYEMGFKESGPYRIWPKYLNRSLTVYCDMETDGGGWIIIQRRGDFEKPRLSFYETWDAYKNGFGDITKEFWLGNDIIFALTNEADTLLRVDLEDFDGQKRYAKYKKFLVRSELEKYKLTFGTYEGNAGDSLRQHDGKEFNTKDNGNHCPDEFKGGWWYAMCHEANLNGLYHEGGYHSSFADGINWKHFRGFDNSMKAAEMKIKRCNC